MMLLNDEERVRAERFHFERHRRRFTVARAMMRWLLAHYLDASPQDLVFDYNKYGKPELNNAQGISFNLSHSADMALLAIGQQHALGVDLEFFSARPYLDIGANLFSDAEMQALRALPLRFQTLGFFHIWAQKEAFIKACGLGLSYPTQAFTVPILPGPAVSILDPQHNRSWQMVSFMPQTACCAALCHDAAVTSLVHQRIDPRLCLS